MIFGLPWQICLALAALALVFALARLVDKLKRILA